MNRADVFVATSEFPRGSVIEKSLLESVIEMDIDFQVYFIESFFNDQLDPDDELLKSTGVIYLSAKNNDRAFPFRVDGDSLKLVLTNELKLELKLSALMRRIEEGR